MPFIKSCLMKQTKCFPIEGKLNLNISKSAVLNSLPQQSTSPLLCGTISDAWQHCLLKTSRCAPLWCARAETLSSSKRTQGSSSPALLCSNNLHSHVVCLMQRSKSSFVVGLCLRPWLPISHSLDKVFKKPPLSFSLSYQVGIDISAISLTSSRTMGAWKTALVLWRKAIPLEYW